MVTDGRVQDVVRYHERLRSGGLEQRGEPEIGAERHERPEQDPPILRLAIRVRRDEEEREAEEAEVIEQREAGRVVRQGSGQHRGDQRVQRDRGQQPVHGARA